jgi:sugar/nucleoside kinase (ribokinase family)
MARDLGKPVTCDLDRVTTRTRELLATVTVPILAENLPSEITGHVDIEAALRALKEPAHTHVVVTLGVGGAAMLHGDQFVRVPGVAVNAIDTTGAGDVFRGAFIHALLRREGPTEILRFANAAAAVSCTHEGALESVPTAEEVAGLYSSSYGSPPRT